MPDPAIPDAAPLPNLTPPALAAPPWFTKIPRQVWVPIVSGIIINWALAYISGRWHFDLASWLQPIVNQVYGATSPGTAPPGAQAVLAIGLSGIIACMTPPSFSDVYKYINSKVIAHAILDKSKSDVSPAQINSAVIAVAAADAPKI